MFNEETYVPDPILLKAKKQLREAQEVIQDISRIILRQKSRIEEIERNIDAVIFEEIHGSWPGNVSSVEIRSAEYIDEEYIILNLDCTEDHEELTYKEYKEEIKRGRNEH